MLANWSDLDGWSTAHGIALEELPLSRLLNLTWHVLMRNRSDEERSRLESVLLLPPTPDVADVDGSPWSADAEMAAFAAAAQRHAAG